jgi:hypothetical protein
VTVGHRQKVTLIKNDRAAHNQIIEFDFLYGLRPDDPAGIDKVAELLDLGQALGEITTDGAYYVGDRLIGRGRRNAINGLTSDRALMWELFTNVMEATSRRRSSGARAVRKLKRPKV